VRIVVPYAAGGPTDASARLIAEAMRPHLGQSVVIENKGGAGGIPGTEEVVRSTADGYTLLLGGAGPLVVSPAAKRLRYDVRKDLAPLGQTWRSAQVLAVHPKLGVKSLAELVAYAKANPAALNAGSAGVGTLPHLSIEMLNQAAGIKIVHVPFRGTGAALPNLLGGQIELMFGDVAVLAPNIETKNLIALAVTSPERSPRLPDLPTVAEAGFPALVAESWYGLLAPARVPPAVLGQIEAALRQALADPAYRESAKKHGSEVAETSSALFGRLIESETEKWAPVVRSAGFDIQ
jgi:tripartite-type tricarboxylate transporter receptor subunit TctC